MKTQVRALAQISLSLVLAVKSDFIEADGSWRIGTMYFLRSAITGEFDGRPFYISQYTDKNEFIKYYTARMVYVALRPFDEAAVQQEIKEIELITNTEQNEKSA